MIKKKAVIFLLLILNIYCIKKGNEMKNDLITVEGIAEVSKAGLVIDGVMLLDYPDMEKYEGKHVKATGIIERNHPFKIRKHKEGEPAKQGFNMPIMTKIQSFEIIEK